MQTDHDRTQILLSCCDDSIEDICEQHCSASIVAELRRARPIVHCSRVDASEQQCSAEEQVSEFVI